MSLAIVLGPESLRVRDYPLSSLQSAYIFQGSARNGARFPSNHTDLLSAFAVCDWHSGGKSWCAKRLRVLLPFPPRSTHYLTHPPTSSRKGGICFFLLWPPRCLLTRLPARPSVSLRCCCSAFTANWCPLGRPAPPQPQCRRPTPPSRCPPMRPRRSADTLYRRRGLRWRPAPQRRQRRRPLL